jgi:hypothetical protein
MVGADEDALTPPAFEAAQWSGHGTQNRAAGVLVVVAAAAEDADKETGTFQHRVEFRALEREGGKAGDRGKAEPLAAAHFVVGEGGNVVVEGALDGGVLRHVGLNEHLPGPFAASGAAGHLGQEGEGSLGRAEVGDEQADIGQHGPHERNALEMQAFCDDLGAEDNIDFPVGDASPGVVIGAATRHRIKVHAEQAGVGESGGEFLFDSLGPLADDGEAGVGALGAPGGHGDFAPAEMTDQPRLASRRNTLGAGGWLVGFLPSRRVG